MPAKGTTFRPLFLCVKISSFNYRAREGHDQKLLLTDFTPEGFNYRAREGHDTGRRRAAPDVTVSTTVPAKGTTFIAALKQSRLMFQLPCPRRARRNGARWVLFAESFNYRAREGHDFTPSGSSPRVISFNYRAREGHD